MTSRSHHVIVVGMTALLGMAGCLSDDTGADPEQTAPTTDEAQAAVTSSFHRIMQWTCQGNDAQTWQIQ
jgi:hypothetical protein